MEVKQRTFDERRLKFGTDCGEQNLTDQSFKDECDINRVLDRSKHGASLSHLLNYQGEYGDFSDWDERTYERMLEQNARALTIFNDLPAELRVNEFDNNPGKFFKFVNDPKNSDRLAEIFPALAKPGRQFADVTGEVTTQALKEAATALTQLASASSNAPTDTTDASNTASADADADTSGAN